MALLIRRLVGSLLGVSSSSNEEDDVDNGTEDSFDTPEMDEFLDENQTAEEL